ncbi:hypothetical protein Rt10032_c09g3911 [Rhodotorula toruloides]|uniref:Elongation factor 1 alpha-like protein n=1 Tax=Rhodotorula toruloides TaxID=5286 RepID=A0A511KKA1_RHOTO|nr:hypothetical protein Rt10032_c09g3911 [Rhodotorula toruloides]
MSRHRAVKNLDLDDELDDGAFDEGGDYYEDMTSEQQAQMAQALSAVQAVLGTDSNIPDKSIRDALWDSYFDVEGTIAYLLDEQHKKEARRKKEEGTATSPPLYVPPTASLASLSLDKSSEPALLPSSAQPAPKNKLAAMTAANRAAKATAPAFSSTPSLAPPAPAPTVQAAPPPEKKLSKLQQKMLSSRAAKAAPPAPSPAPSAPEPAPAPVAAPAPESSASAEGPMSIHSPAFSSTSLVAENRLAKQARKAASGASSQPGSAKNSRPSTPAPGAGKPKKAAPPAGSSARPAAAGPVSQLRTDIEAMGLGDGSSRREEERMKADEEPAPAVTMSKEKILKEVKAKAAKEKPVLSLVVIGHVDAGKSTLMGRVLHELGETTDREVANNQRQSEKIGKGSFAYAWTFDAMDEERERGVTIDVAIDSFSTQRRRFTLIDAPGHRDFVPNMISGAAQADVAILVVDGASGAFEKGFEGGGQTREHALLVRSLGVQQIIVAVNKLDAVRWSQVRYKNIFDQLYPFLTDIGFVSHKITFVPVSATSGENLTKQTNELLRAWYDGPTLVEELDSLPVPTRVLDVPLRIPVSNVFKGQAATASGLAVTGRIESGIVQVGEKLAALPGDESGVVRALEVEGELVPYATAGDNATIFLSGIEANQLSVGSILCPPSQPVPVVSTFTAQVLVFEPKHPITAGYAVELFHHSRDIPASIVALEAILDKTTGQIIKSAPRMLPKNSSARIRVQLRNAATGGRSDAIPIEPFAVNKAMGRVLFRRNGETVAAGIVLETLQ